MKIILKNAILKVIITLQGEVEQIALMKPKAQNEHETGMLEFLEDIMGTNRYKVPLEKLNEKVEILSERRMEKMNRVKAAEKEKEELEGPMNEVVQFLRMENTITKLRHKSLQFKRWAINYNFSSTIVLIFTLFSNKVRAGR